MYALWSLRLPTAPKPAQNRRVKEYRSLRTSSSRAGCRGVGEFFQGILAVRKRQGSDAGRVQKSTPHRTEPDIAEAVPCALANILVSSSHLFIVSHNSSAPGNRPFSWTCRLFTTENIHLSYRRLFTRFSLKRSHQPLSRTPLTTTTKSIACTGCILLQLGFIQHDASDP